jgi:GTP-binding protein HflX
MDHPDSRTFIGSGKLKEIKLFLADNPFDMLVFDDELSPSQTRNLERELEIKVVDRTNLILDIFAQRAITSYARTQVELAQYQYILPRLTNMWKHLQKQKGGIGMKGPGEKEIETDRRIIRDKISLLKEKLKIIDRQMTTQRQNRGELVRVALVGYTNVGKSTIMNLISKSEILAENKLFATLDTTVRKVVIQNLPFLLSDTVGFIRKLPTQLVESFKSTLDEVREADLLLHVVDISHTRFEDHMAVVKQTLNDIGAADKPVIVVFNKIDALAQTEANALKEHWETNNEESEKPGLKELMDTWMSKQNSPAIFISATNKLNWEDFKDLLYQRVKSIHEVRYPYNKFLY